MSDNKKNIFRQQALNQLSSPESLDKLMQVVSPKDWLPLGGLACLGAIGVFWSIFGNIPITIPGKGILINPLQVVKFQSPLSGQLESLHIRDGQCVKKDEILGTINPSDKKQQLQQQKDKLAQLQQQIGQMTLLRQQKSRLETEEIIIEHTSLKQQLQDAQKLTPLLKDEELKSVLQERHSLQQNLKDAEELTPILQQRVIKEQELQKQGVLSERQVLQAQQEYRQSRQKIGEIQAQLKQLQVKETELQQKYLKSLNSITKLKAELSELDIRSKQLEQNNLEATNTENNQIQEVEQAIARLEKEVTDNSSIKSPYTGCILEITATEGQYLNPGTSLGTLQIERKASELMGITYFAVKDGKKIQPGMKILITPDTVKRTRYGGIVGEITEISPFPVTSEGATHIVGNSEIVKQLMGEEGGKIQAIAHLQINPQTFSGYEWSSSDGPNLEISPGTTTKVRATVEERSPITWVLPILREWSGIF